MTIANKTLVIGPELLFLSFESLVEEICDNLNDSPNYSSLDEFIGALDTDPLILQELSDLKNLDSTNDFHWQNALDHTLSVVENLRACIDENDFSEKERQLLVLAAYLHDIGKSKSPRENGKYQPDPNHAYRGIPLLGRIFTEEITCLNEQDLKLILKLVIYDDLIGEVIGKNRHQEQILQVVDSMKEFEMLVAICNADITSLINPNMKSSMRLCFQPRQWLQNIDTNLPELKEYVHKQLEDAE